MYPHKNQLVCTLTLGILHLYTGAMMTDLTVEQYYKVYHEWSRSAFTQPRREVSSNFNAIIKEEEWNAPKNAHHHSCLVSAYTILIM